MGLAFVPLYIKYLGVEAYGLIGLFSVLMAWLVLLDMGMTPMISREMARFNGGGHSAGSIRDLLRSVECILLGTSVLIIGGGALLAPWAAAHWLRVETLSVNTAANAIAVMGLVAALRFAEGIYRSCLVGLQRQVALNLVSSGMATLRAVGTVGVLAWVSPTISAFFIWQGVVSIATLAILALTTYHTLPAAQRSGRFSLAALRGVWQFAGGMIGITFLALLLTQMDKVILSRMLSLADYGYYTLAAAVASSVLLLITPISQAWFPRLCELHMQDNESSMIDFYHTGAQLVSVVGGGVAVVLILLAEQFLVFWTRNTDLAARVAPLLRLLLLGNLLNGLMHIPYQTQLAYGWTSLTTRINLVSVLLIVPAILWVTPRYGSEGVAWVWVVLNSGYVLIGVHFMYRRILSKEKWRWYGQDVFTPLVASLAGGFLMKSAWEAMGIFANTGVLLTLVSVAAFGASFALSGRLVSEVRKITRKALS